jgi:hypothetical protein
MIPKGDNLFAHSRPDKIGTPRLLPLYIRNILIGISAKKSPQRLSPFGSGLKNSLRRQKEEDGKGKG